MSKTFRHLCRICRVYHIVILWLIFWETMTLFSVMVPPIFILPVMPKSFNFCAFLPTLVFLVVVQN